MLNSNQICVCEQCWNINYVISGWQDVYSITGLNVAAVVTTTLGWAVEGKEPVVTHALF